MGAVLRHTSAVRRQKTCLYYLSLCPALLQQIRSPEGIGTPQPLYPGVLGIPKIREFDWLLACDPPLAVVLTHAPWLQSNRAQGRLREQNNCRWRAQSAVRQHVAYSVRVRRSKTCLSFFSLCT